jgi:predicted RNase H-like HicB family nuclease
MSAEQRRITLTEEGEWWVAKDETVGEHGVASQGHTRREALENLDEAVALFKGEIGRPPTDEELQEWGIDPETVADEPGVPDAPWFDTDE